jgi:hypothetical protein
MIEIQSICGYQACNWMARHMWPHTVLFYAKYIYIYISYDTGGVLSVINFQPSFVKINSSKYTIEGHKWRLRQWQCNPHIWHNEHASACWMLWSWRNSRGMTADANASHLSSILKHLISQMCQHSSTQASHIETISTYMTKCWLHLVNWTVVVFESIYIFNNSFLP